MASSLLLIVLTLCISDTFQRHLTLATPVQEHENTQGTNKDQLRQPNTRRTIVFIRASTIPGQNVFIRGGASEGGTLACSEDTPNDPCAIPITHRVRPTDPGSSYLQWSEGDNFLDWNGAEVDQGTYEGEEAGGTPLMWTTWDDAHPARIETDGHGYTAYNRFGEHFWMLDVDMDCGETDDGWFEFKTYVTPLPGWEGNINQFSKCAGEPDNPKPFSSINHMALCGKMSVFFYEENECSVYDIPDDPEEPVSGECGQRKMFDDKKLMLTSLRADDTKPAEHHLVNDDDTVPHIVNGDAAVMGRWPWQGVLQYGSTIGGCAAVLIYTNWALTAAHCVSGTNPAILKVRLGEQNLAVTQGHEQDIQVTNIIMHFKYGNPDPGDPYNDNDIALLELSSPVDLSSYVVNLACLPHGYGTDDFVNNNDCWATGFGDTRGTGDSYRLYEINVPVWSHIDCVSYQGDDRVTVRQVCIGTDTLSACGGDSGGPLVCHDDGRWVAVGLTSWGTSTCSNGPSVYTRLTEFLDWIQSITSIVPTSCD